MNKDSKWVIESGEKESEYVKKIFEPSPVANKSSDTSRLYDTMKAMKPGDWFRIRLSKPGEDDSNYLTNLRGTIGRFAKVLDWPTVKSRYGRDTTKRAYQTIVAPDEKGEYLWLWVRRLPEE